MWHSRQRAAAVLDGLVANQGAPGALRLDNGPELTAEALAIWAATYGIAVRSIQPGRPHRNADIERFNRMYPEQVLDADLFASLDEVGAVTEDWRPRYNTERAESGSPVPPRELARQPCPRRSPA